MKTFAESPWHKASWDRFVNEGLPHLLKSYLPLVAYDMMSTGTYTCRIDFTLEAEGQKIEFAFEDLPQPDAEGIFKRGPIDWVKSDNVIPGEWGGFRVVVPVPSSRDLATAEIKCVGEQLFDAVEARLKDIPEDLPWEEDVVRSWLALDEWLADFSSGATSQFLQVTNWLDRTVHRRRLTYIPMAENGRYTLGADEVLFDNLPGRACPLTVPEGPNLGWFVEVATGAEIQDGKLVVVDESDAGKLGAAASMVPFLEHTDPARALMGVNMMRQWFVPRDTTVPGGPGMSLQICYEPAHERLLKGEDPKPEPALVQTGNEPDVPDFWGGYNLLTAFVLWDDQTFDDAIVISESCAERMNFPLPVEVGDKLSNRHGTFGVISRILPDSDMPTLPDGTPVELICDPTNLISRLNFGQVREAVMGRVAKAMGKPVVVPPFQSFNDEALREQLKKAGLPEDGMELLSVKGKALSERSTVGWVYWGRLSHIAEAKLRASVDAENGQRLGAGAYRKLRGLKAFELIREQLNTHADKDISTEQVVAQVANGEAVQVGFPARTFARLQTILSIAGIKASVEDGELALAFAEPEGLKLVRPVAHPWLKSESVTSIGTLETLTERSMMVNGNFRHVESANKRLAEMVNSGVPEMLQKTALEKLEEHVSALFNNLLREDNMRLQARIMFSGQAVAVPDASLTLEQVGLPEEMAWTLFAPQVVRELGDEGAVASRTPKAQAALDVVMKKSWVVVYKDPSPSPYSFVAFRPVRVADRSVHVHPFVACNWLEVGFSAQQVGVFLPVTEAAQQEAAERLSVAGQIAEYPERLSQLLRATRSCVTGLYLLTRREGGKIPAVREELSALVGTDVGTIDSKGLPEMVKTVLKKDGDARAFEVIEALMQKGFDRSKASGASISAFLGSAVDLGERPDDDPDLWEVYLAEARARLDQTVAHQAVPELNTFFLLMDSGSRGNQLQVVRYLTGCGLLTGFDGESVVVKNGYCEGVTAQEYLALTADIWRALAHVNVSWGTYQKKGQALSDGSVLVRASAVRKPGLVFARAAQSGERDPLKDVYSRLFVGV